MRCYVGVVVGLVAPPMERPSLIATMPHFVTARFARLAKWIGIVSDKGRRRSLGELGQRPPPSFWRGEPPNKKALSKSKQPKPQHKKPRKPQNKPALKQ